MPKRLREGIDNRPAIEEALAGMRVANAPCSWGIMGSLTPDPAPDYKQVLDGIVEAGYAGTELGDYGFMPTEPKKLKPELERRHLAMVGAFTPLELTDPANLEASLATAVRTGRLLAAVAAEGSRPGPYVIVAADSSLHPQRREVAGRVTPKDSLSHADWRVLAKGAEKVAAAVRDEVGLPTVFHPHCATPVETLAETVRFLEMTDRQLLPLCFDTGHVAYAGDNLYAATEQLSGRSALVHFKDMDRYVAEDARKNKWPYERAVREGLFCELRRGCVNFRAVRAVLLSTGYQGWIVVEDELPPGVGDRLESAIRDREFLRGLGL